MTRIKQVNKLRQNISGDLLQSSQIPFNIPELAASYKHQFAILIPRFFIAILRQLLGIRLYEICSSLRNLYIFGRLYNQRTGKMLDTGKSLLQIFYKCPRPTPLYIVNRNFQRGRLRTDSLRDKNENRGDPFNLSVNIADIY